MIYHLIVVVAIFYITDDEDKRPRKKKEVRVVEMETPSPSPALHHDDVKIIQRKAAHSFLILVGALSFASQD